MWGALLFHITFLFKRQKHQKKYNRTRQPQYQSLKFDSYDKKRRRQNFTRRNHEMNKSQKLGNTQEQPLTKSHVRDRRYTIIHQRNRSSLLIKFSQIWKRNCCNRTDCNRKHQHGS
ncbi:MAG: hypothetical protein EZS28_033287 [Streblomastix strix]|uniref:Uncharacterized protein n=1 Tax=Streblomastix strix TaxID=222440 RepID=A0A5J4UL95_9EUKA|nr:MAG: hypothetical protein EZS28_033287 [Streblomastix strix]